MKKLSIRLVGFFLLSCLCFGSVAYAADLGFKSAKAIGKTVEKVIPAEFGYVDNTEYYMKRYFSSLNSVDDSYIATSSESTNFNEFGIFHLENKAELKAAKKTLRDYLDKRKSEFESGVIYNTAEYPKFQNATVITFDNYICYTILNPSDLKKASLAVKELLSQ